MDVGMMMVFASYGWEDCTDARVWDEEIRLARLAAELGFDCLWSAEHHFADYSFVPDNLQLMTYLTAICPDIDVGTAAVILPWHDPLWSPNRRWCWTTSRKDGCASAWAAASRGASSPPSVSAWTNPAPVSTRPRR